MPPLRSKAEAPTSDERDGSKTVQVMKLYTSGGNTKAIQNGPEAAYVHSSVTGAEKHVGIRFGQRADPV
jgi:hypothetical protein